MRYKVKTRDRSYEIESTTIEVDILRAEGISYEEIIESAPFIILSQRDPRWGKVTIGQSGLELEDFGCTLTSLSMHSGWYGKLRYPDWLAKNAKFTKDGKILWQSLNDIDLPFKFVWRFYGANDAKLREILFSKNDAAIVEVNLGKGKHWLSLIGYDDNLGFRCADPYYGDTCYIASRYKKYTGFTQITRK